VIHATIQSIEKIPRSSRRKGWRLHTALIPAGVADLRVTVEKQTTLRPLVSLLLRTIHLLEEESGAATLDELAKFTGLQAEAVEMVVLRLVDENFVLFDEANRVVKQNPELQIQDNQVRYIAEESREVCLIGRDPFPAPELSSQHLSRSRGILMEEKFASLLELDIDGWKTISEETLKKWRTHLADRAHIQKISLLKKPRPYGYLLAGRYDSEGVYTLLDNRSKVKLDLGNDHPFVIELRELAKEILGSLKTSFWRFGDWNDQEYELRSNVSQWQAWLNEGGSSLSEVRISGGGVQIAITVKCLPADRVTAKEIFFENILERLGAHPGAISDTRLVEACEKEHNHPDFREHEITNPTMSEIEAAAWDRGHWTLAYQIATVEDRLFVPLDQDESLD
jgi:hypothetical protein